jgi:hypothetical protein
MEAAKIAQLGPGKHLVWKQNEKVAKALLLMTTFACRYIYYLFPRCKISGPHHELAEN